MHQNKDPKFSHEWLEGQGGRSNRNAKGQNEPTGREPDEQNFIPVSGPVQSSRAAKPLGVRDADQRQSRRQPRKLPRSASPILSKLRKHDCPVSMANFVPINRKSIRPNVFTWFKNRRRKKIISQPWPEAWSLHLNRNVRLSWGLTESQMERLREIVKIFVAEKNWEGLEGLAVTEEMQVTIAAQAGLLLLGTPNFYFDNVRTILVFPKSFSREVIDGGVVGQTYRAGEAWQGGPVILSWKDTLRGGRNEDDGHNLVIHEFAHALDGLDGEMAGQVIFDDPAISAQWKTVVNREFARLCHARDQGIRTLLDHYGATNKAEFFAVSTETFFELPEELRQQHAELFELLSTYYRVDPRQWSRARPRNT